MRWPSRHISALFCSPRVQWSVFVTLRHSYADEQLIVLLLHIMAAGGPRRPKLPFQLKPEYTHEKPPDPDICSFYISYRTHVTYFSISTHNFLSKPQLFHPSLSNVKIIFQHGQTVTHHVQQRVLFLPLSDFTKSNCSFLRSMYLRFNKAHT